MSFAFFSTNAIIILQRLVRDIYRSTGKKFELRDERFIFTMSTFLGQQSNRTWKDSFESVLRNSDLDRHVFVDVMRLMKGNERQHQTQAEAHSVAELSAELSTKLSTDSSTESSDEASTKVTKKKVIYRGQTHYIDEVHTESKPKSAKLTYRGRPVSTKK